MNYKVRKFELKTKEEIEIMREGGSKLGRVKHELERAVKKGVNALEIETLAQELIKKEGAAPSFAMVPGYKWATCVNVNEGVVHGIPKKEVVFKNGDIVSVDVGIYHKGFHTDTSTSVLVGKDKKLQKFLETGKSALVNAIKVAKEGKMLGAISWAIESTLRKEGYSPIKSLVGHGIGRELHEDPIIPCYLGYPGENFVLKVGTTLAIEVMYTMGSGKVETEDDGWTIRTKDGKISALFEETVAVVKDGPFILTT